MVVVSPLGASWYIRSNSSANSFGVIGLISYVGCEAREPVSEFIS